MATQRGPKIIRTGLVLHLDAADRQSCSGTGATKWNDLSGNSEHFTLYNSPTFNSSYGGELRFDGSNDYARRRNSNIINNIAANGSIEVWTRSYDGVLGGYDYSRLISIANDAGTGSDTDGTRGSTTNDYSDFIAISRNKANYYALWYKDGSPSGWGDTTTYADNIYRQIIFTWSTSGASMTFNHYINSISKLSQSFTRSNFSAAKHITISEDSNCALLSSTPQVNKGAYSIVRFYSKTLSQAEISQNFNANRGRFGV